MESGQAELNIIDTLQQADNKQIWSNTNKIPLRDKEGNVFGILGTCEDITEPKNDAIATIGLIFDCFKKTQYTFIPSS